MFRIVLAFSLLLNVRSAPSPYYTRSAVRTPTSYVEQYLIVPEKNDPYKVPLSEVHHVNDFKFPNQQVFYYNPKSQSSSSLHEVRENDPMWQNFMKMQETKSEMSEMEMMEMTEAAKIEMMQLSEAEMKQNAEHEMMSTEMNSKLSQRETRLMTEAIMKSGNDFSNPIVVDDEPMTQREAKPMAMVSAVNDSEPLKQEIIIEPQQMEEKKLPVDAPLQMNLVDIMKALGLANVKIEADKISSLMQSESDVPAMMEIITEKQEVSTEIPLAKMSTEAILSPMEAEMVNQELVKMMEETLVPKIESSEKVTDPPTDLKISMEAITEAPQTEKEATSTTEAIKETPELLDVEKEMLEILKSKLIDPQVIVELMTMMKEQSAKSEEVSTESSKEVSTESSKEVSTESSEELTTDLKSEAPILEENDSMPESSITQSKVENMLEFYESIAKINQESTNILEMMKKLSASTSTEEMKEIISESLNERTSEAPPTTTTTKSAELMTNTMEISSTSQQEVSSTEATIIMDEMMQSNDRSREAMELEVVSSEGENMELRMVEVTTDEIKATSEGGFEMQESTETPTSTESSANDASNAEISENENNSQEQEEPAVNVRQGRVNNSPTLFLHNNRFYVISGAPEFYANFDAYQKPRTPIFSLQELQPIRPIDKNARVQRVEPFRIFVGEEENENSESKPFNGEARDIEMQSMKLSAEEVKKPEQVTMSAERELSDESAIANASPDAIAIAGKGGVASSKPQATAVSDKKGLSIASPQGTAIAGDFNLDDIKKKRVQLRRMRKVKIN